jgi:uncharacterized membrane protein YdfJ with MMPL/SSD domain
LTLVGVPNVAVPQLEVVGQMQSVSMSPTEAPSVVAMTRVGRDFKEFVVAALTTIFIIMLLITRSLIAAAVIVGSVVVSLGASFGMSVLIWQHLLGKDLQFMVMAMAVIVLLAVGSDYNLLLEARMKEEIAAGINTGSSAPWATADRS